MILGTSSRYFGGPESDRTVVGGRAPGAIGQDGAVVGRAAHRVEHEWAARPLEHLLPARVGELLGSRAGGRAAHAFARDRPEFARGTHAAERRVADERSALLAAE